jgi:hypothetical protein
MKATKWLSIFPNDQRAKFDNDYVGFAKKDDRGFNMGGCYLYAYDPTGEIVNETPDHLDERVIYIGTAGSSTARGICSRTLDFSGTVIRGLSQKNPYENGMYFRAIYGEENKRHLYVAYFPMGYGPEIKLKAHGKESELISEYKSVYGSLPPVDGRQGPEVMIREHAKALTVSQMKEHIRWCMNQLKMNGESIDE